MPMGDANVVSNSEIIGELTQRQLIAQSKFLSTVFDVSRYAEAGRNAIEFPKAGDFSVVKKTSGVPVTSQALTYTTDVLDLDQQAVVRWGIEWKSKIQSEVDVMNDAIGRASRAQALQADIDIMAEIYASSGAALTAQADGSFSRENITSMIENLDLQNVPEDERVLGVNPSEKKKIMDLADFVNANKLGSDRIVSRGQIGELFGIPVISSTVVTTKKPVMYHREAIAFGFQKNPEFKSDEDLDNLSDEYVLWQLYGLKGLLDTKAACSMDLDT